MIQALLNNNLTNQIVRDENILVQRASVFLSVAFHLTGALFLYLVSIHLGWEIGGIGTGFSRFLFLQSWSQQFILLNFCFSRFVVGYLTLTGKWRLTLLMYF